MCLRVSFIKLEANVGLDILTSWVAKLLCAVGSDSFSMSELKSVAERYL